MNKKMVLKLSGFIGTAGLTVALVSAGVASTGAYFTDSKPGTVTATLGTILVNTDTNTLAFDKMLPGVTQTKTVNFQNTGNTPQDVWVVFNDADLAGLNTLGNYAGIQIKGSGIERFSSENLGYPALGKQYLLAEDVAPTLWQTMEFSAKLGAKATDQVGLAAGAALGSLHYTIVATQVDIAPDNPLNSPS